MKPSKGDVQANSMGPQIREIVCRIPPISAASVVLLSVIANRAYTRKSKMGTTEIVAG